jgi:tRNA nucleotidyltransferase (CCA-adding enzyme)
MISFDDLAVPQKRALDLVRETAAEKQCRPFLVGGPVRDLLLGRHAVDIDITVEQDSSTLARALAKRLGGRVRSFPQFLTYKVTAEAMPEIDIATARREKYPRPGALPTVQPGKLKDDLLRRDFAINAMALDVLTGELHDPADGASDLEARLVRVLHDRSFVDDPTRVFRGIRLATRLGFAIEPHTTELMHDAIADGALTTVAKERIWRELFLAMDEADAPDVVAAIVCSGATEVLFGKREDGDALRSRLEIARREISMNPELDCHVMYTAAILHGNASPVDLEGSGFSQKRARNLVQIANEVGRFSDALAEAKSDRHRFRLLKHASPEMLSVLSATAPTEQEHVARFHEFRDFKLPLRGTDLEVPLGPHVAKALERTKEAVFTGEIDVSQARTFAREVALKYLDRDK